MNEEMKALPKDDDYCCFIDGDVMFSTPFFGHHLHHIVDAYPECGIFTCMTNRVGSRYQVYGPWESDDMKELRQCGKDLYRSHRSDVQDITEQSPMSGHLMMIRKGVWKLCGGFDEGLLGVDNSIHIKAREAGQKVYLMKGIYVIHWYRGGNRRNKRHLKLKS